VSVRLGEIRADGSAEEIVRVHTSRATRWDRVIFRRAPNWSDAVVDSVKYPEIVHRMRLGRGNQQLSLSSHRSTPSRQSTWYPVVFPDRCDGCQSLETPKCIAYCQHEVFAILDDKVIVIKPQNCIYGCTACRPVCPHDAIEFPLDQGFGKAKDKAWTEGLKQLTCRQCGRVFWSETQRDTCYDCLGKVYADGRLHNQKGSPRP
jgi:NAD-dependent dihydropyrimidine dehydrogenase PreA subunit